jgi:hypothetical protein
MQHSELLGKIAIFRPIHRRIVTAGEQRCMTSSASALALDVALSTDAAGVNSVWATLLAVKIR